MKLYFLRHAEAEDGEIDHQRELTEKGRRDSRRVGEYLQSIEVCFQLAFTSPLARAVQTAQLVLKHCASSQNTSLTETDALLNESGDTRFRAWLKGLPQVESVLLVGHEPSISHHVRQLIGMPLALSLPFPKGALARVDTENRSTGALRLLVTPKQLP